MAQALPLTKLAGLLVKALAKPLSKRIKHEFSRYAVTQQILVSIGQTSHAVTSRMTIWGSGYKVRSITPLEREKAMSHGAEFVGESFVVLVSGGVVVWEYNRSKEKERKKEAKNQTELRAQNQALQAKLHTLDVRLNALENVVKANSRSLLSFGAKYVEPTDTVPIDDEPSDENEETEAVPKPDTGPEKQQRWGGSGWWPWK